jgi:hypothetical protein
MATGSDVLNMLLPQGGWIIVGDDFDGITWVDERPRCTKAKFEAGFAQYDSFKAAQDLDNVTKKEALLTKLGITTDEAALLLS